jgi:hypothetical protein
VTDVDPGKDDTEQAQQSKRYEDDHAGGLIQEQNCQDDLAD